MALIPAHLKAGVILAMTVQWYVYNLSLPPPPHPHLHSPVPNKLYGFCEREAPWKKKKRKKREKKTDRQQSPGTVKVEVAVLGY